MRTAKPFSTISYNTKEFLAEKLNELILKREIEFWAYMEHLPEDDETKKHKHLYIIPAKQYDTFVFVEQLQEPDKSNLCNKPLGCINCKSSKFDDWYLYALHDIAYLASKGQTRKYHYKHEEFVVSDSDFFNEQRHCIDYSKLNRMSTLISAVDTGKSFYELVNSGLIPVQLINQYEKVFNILSFMKNQTERNGKDGHEFIDKETGEILF